MSKNIKLLHITTVPESFNFFKGQIGYMKARGVEIHALSSPGDLLEEFGKREQVPTYAVTMPRSITPLKDIYSIFQIWQHIRRICPHIVHTHTPKGGLLGTIAAWLAGVPVLIYHIHGLPLMTAKGYKRVLLTWSEKVSCLLAHRVISVSHSIRKVAIREGLCPPEKITVMLGGSYNGVDASDRFNLANLPSNTRLEIRRKYSIPKDAIVLGFVGRLVRDKGVEELVGAWQILREEFPNLHLLVVGYFEPQDPLSDDAKELLMSDPRIHMTGRMSHMPPLYAAMDIFTLPTYREGLGDVLLEASAMKLPVVATDIPGCVDAVEDGYTGLLVPPCDPEVLAEKIRKYIQNAKLRYQHGNAGRDRILQKFRQEPIWEALYQEYLKLLPPDSASGIEEEIVLLHSKLF
ncbi:capsule biosynthesis protein CapM [Scytonema hofmannii PCC 7110]|uniref:Capsule biosynthesis protein CapM n=1 Tax=Scytonema hofmannii PCC 7110 TaxID=128403 RepID=A0A139WXC0_9CYAN|nr:glycosyltransferase family 4 protein [Scytonema hofmannii]KYC37087.1 capsule biosynthesis protein CapM [Scytonema hofmannii PCC 7110]